MGKLKYLFFFFVVLFATSFWGCRKQDSLIMDLTPKALELEVEAGQSIFFRINITAPVKIVKFTVTKIRINAPDSILLDTLPASKSFSLNWGLKTKKNSNENIQLLFKAMDENGNEVSDQRLVKSAVKNTLVLFSNNTMFSAGNTSFNSFDLNEMTAKTYDSALYDTMPNLIPDLRELAITKDNNAEIATKYWYSPSGGKFIKIQGLNFESASKTEVINVFSSGLPALQYTDSLKVGDVYAFKTAITDPNPLTCLLRIENIVSGNGILAKYIFSVRK